MIVSSGEESSFDKTEAVLGVINVVQLTNYVSDTGYGTRMTYAGVCATNKTT